VFFKLDTALIELTANKMRVWINETPVTRAAVATVVGDPTFQGLGSWTTASTTAGASATVSGGVYTLHACRPAGWRRSRRP
jgi:hypothetical protein